MKKEVLISLLGILPIVVSCTTETDDIIDQINVEESVNEVEITEEVVIEDENPFGLSSSVVTQRNALLKMTTNTSDLNWGKDVELENWDAIEIDGNENIVSLRIDASFVNVESSIGSLTFLNLLKIEENPILAENGLDLPNLETLVIENDPLTFMPEWILETESLKSISYSDSRLESIPDKIDQLTNLEYLTVEDGTPLAKVSANLGDLQRLIKVDFSLVSNDDLTTVPSEICELAETKVKVLLPSDTLCN